MLLRFFNKTGVNLEKRFLLYLDAFYHVKLQKWLFIDCRLGFNKYFRQKESGGMSNREKSNNPPLAQEKNKKSK